jgi:hypothetical protein
VYVKIYIGKTVEHNDNYLLLVTQYYNLLYNATSFDSTMGVIIRQRTENWGHEMYMEVPYGIPFGLHSPLYLSLYLYLYLYLRIK